MTDKQTITLQGKNIVEYFELIVENKKLKDNLYDKEQECDKLKKELIKKDETITFYVKKDEINALFNTPINNCSNGHCEICKYKQTLTEIKEIAEYELNNLTDSAIHSGRYSEILDKISECEAKNENK